MSGKFNFYLILIFLRHSLLKYHLLLIYSTVHKFVITFRIVDRDKKLDISAKKRRREMFQVAFESRKNQLQFPCLQNSLRPLEHSPGDVKHVVFTRFSYFHQVTRNFVANSNTNFFSEGLSKGRDSALISFLF
jgi:hypothetical protein